MPNLSVSTVKTEEMVQQNGDQKNEDQFVEIGDHYMVKRSDDTWRKFWVGDNKELTPPRLWWVCFS